MVFMSLDPMTVESVEPEFRDEDRSVSAVIGNALIS